MDTITKHFERMGARVKVIERKAAPVPVAKTNPKTLERTFGSVPPPRPDFTFSVNIKKDRKGSYFEILKGEGVDVSILDVQSDDRHLVIMAKTPNVPRQVFMGRELNRWPATKSKFLAGHDERDWFVAAIPESAAVSTVLSAKEALKPSSVQAAQSILKPKDRNRRHNKSTHRQGEWFFIPSPDMNPPENLILRKEPIRRGSGKPHVCAELYREKGSQVWVNSQHPNGLTYKQFSALSEHEQKKGNFRVMMRDADVYVRGAISHPDHKTLHLNGWHMVQMNTETKSNAMRMVSFLD